MKETIGLIAAVLSIVGYIPYIRDIITKKTKPHAFTWVVWTAVAFIVGFAQLAAGAGWGAIHNIVVGFVCLVIVFFALRNKDKDIRKIDVVFFIGALAAIPLWLATKDPLYSIILLTAIDLAAVIPTVRKTWRHPSSETLSSYVIAGIKYFISLGALTVYGLSTLLYPVALIIMNCIIITIILTRRRLAANG